MTNIPYLIQKNDERWGRCEIKPSRIAEVNEVAERLVEPVARSKYVILSNLTSVPWWVIAVIHEREADQNWKCSIAQGDPWNHVSRHVPRGRGPFKDWLSAGVDALEKCAPFAGRWKDWSAGGTLTLLELYNGTGYEDYHHEASPYIWGATNMEEEGKYIADGHYSATVWDTQLGCAALLKKMMELDASIRFEEIKK
jgi:lysozyme family protein